MTLSGEKRAELDRERRRAEQGAAAAAERVARARKAVTVAKAELSVAIGELDDAEVSAVTDFGLDLDEIQRLGGRWKDATS